uniref:Uncharacterized protein n=1 Tax=Arundo donax TaxID=35708 RepID=A0A0A8Y7Q6_ARUDO
MFWIKIEVVLNCQSSISIEGAVLNSSSHHSSN